MEKGTEKSTSTMARCLGTPGWKIGKSEILKFHSANPLEGYRRLTFIMLDADVVAVSASSVYRVLREAGVMDRHNTKPSKKGTGFGRLSKAHAHWHVDVSYLNICGTFYFMCSVLDGYSRSIIHWEIREKMEEVDVEVILQRAREKYPGESLASSPTTDRILSHGTSRSSFGSPV
ncbi:MAG: hypothetical protein R3C05_17995 [Pirellulaceae bacterium]